MLTSRVATPADSALLAGMNLDLIKDEGHRNAMTGPELEDRMSLWLSSNEYGAAVFELSDEPIGYALYRESSDGVYLRQFFIKAAFRRKGFGKQGLHLLRNSAFPAGCRVTVEVLSANTAGLQFWQSAGFTEYCRTLELWNE